MYYDSIAAGVGLIKGYFLFPHDLVDSVFLADNVALSSYRSCSYWLVSSYHDYFHSCSVAFSHCEGDRIARRVVKGKDASECLLVKGEVWLLDIINREFVVFSILRAREMELCESKDSLPTIPKVLICIIEYFLPFFIFGHSLVSH